METNQIVEKAESHSEMGNVSPLTKHMDSSQQDEDKACLTESKEVQVPEESIVDVTEDQTTQTININESSDIQVTESSPAFVDNLDIPEVTSLHSQQHEDATSSIHHS